MDRGNGKTQQNGPNRATGVFSPPWRGPVRVVKPRNGQSLWDIVDADGRWVCTPPSGYAEALASALNRPEADAAGCGCRAWLLDYADRQRCHKGGNTLAKWLEEIATRLPAPAICPDHDSAEPCPLHRVVKLNPGFPVRVEGGVATSGPNAPDAIYEAAHGLIIGASRPDDAAEIGQLREALAAKDAEIARLREERDASQRSYRAVSAVRDALADRLAAVERERDTYRDALGTLGAGNGQFGRELWLACWMVAAGGDYMSTEMWTNLLDGLADAERERDEARAMQAEWRDVAHQAIELSKRVGGAA